MLRMKSHWLVGTLAVALLAGTLGDAASVRAEDTKFKIGSSRDLQLGAQLGIAMHKGFFKEEGLDIQVAYFTSGAEMTSALAAGQLKLGSFGDFPTVNMIAGNLPVKIITGVAEISGTQQLVVNKGVKKPEDLKGKKIALTVGSSAESLFAATLDHFGVPLDSVEVLNMSAPEQVAAMARGDVDGITVWQPYVLRAKNQAGGHALISALKSFIPGMEGPLSYYAAYSVLVVRTEWLDKNPNTMLKVLRAMKKAQDYINSNKDDTAKTMEKDMRAPAKDLRVFLDENVYDMGIDKKFVRTLNKTVGFMHRVGKIKAKPSVESFIDDSYLKKVIPNRVSY